MKPKGTGVFASEEDYKYLENLASQGWRPGDRLIAFSVDEGVRKMDATLRVTKVCHQMAMEKYGLPEIPGYYGISLNREFVVSD